MTTRVAKAGVLVLGGGVAGSHVARDLGAATIVNPTDLLSTPCPGAELVLGTGADVDIQRRVAEVATAGGLVAVAFAELVIALGSGVNALAAQLGLPVNGNGRVIVDETLRVAGVPHVWALGDCAAVPNAATPGETDPPTRRHAVQQARRLALNLTETPAPYRFLENGRPR
jgi:NADPH-dependent 2,4-dienoyl-CoA reductase/sulfur reductase-like enzyme